MTTKRHLPATLFAVVLTAACSSSQPSRATDPASGSKYDDPNGSQSSTGSSMSGSSTGSTGSSMSGSTGSTGSSMSGSSTTGSTGSGSTGSGSTGSNGMTGSGSTGSMGSTGSTGSMGSTGSTTPSQSMDSSAQLGDEQIMHVTHTANAGEIEQAKLAQQKAKDPRVQKLAAMMLKDHTDADTKGMAIVKKANLTPAANAVSASLESDAKSGTDSLRGQTGAAFDRAYVDLQVKEHQMVLDTIDNKLMPGAKSAEVKGFLSEIRPKMAMHLQHAQDLQRDMAK